MRILLLMLLLAASAPAGNPTLDTIILGDWCAGSAAAFHEEFTLSVEEGQRRFASWLHQRPAESGTWELRGRTLTIHGHSGHDYVYSVVTATSKKLVIQEEGEEPETYVRENCREFEAPPND